MKSTILIIVVTSILSSALTLGGFYFIAPSMIKMPDIPKMDAAKFEMPKFEMPDMEKIMGSKMDEMMVQITDKMPKMPEGMTAGGPPAGVMTGMPASATTASKDMAANVKKMKQAVKDMEKWAGKMEDAGDQMAVTRDQMTAIFNPQVMGTVMALVAYSNSHCTPAP